MNNAPPRPRISVGMPLFNEARFLRQSLDALLAQQDIEFEIIISDNASTDLTPGICEEYLERYPSLVRYCRFDENVGASANFARVLELAKGEYFMWAAGHDLWQSNYLKICSLALDTNPGGVVAFGTTGWIDADGKPLPPVSGWNDTRGSSMPGRYFSVFWGNMNPVLALVRTEALRKQRIVDMVGLDLCILLGLALRGDFMHCPETSWSRRDFRNEASYAQKLERYRSRDYALGKSWLGRHFPLAALPARILGDLLRAPTGLSVKLLMALAVLPSLLLKYLVDRKKKRQLPNG